MESCAKGVFFVRNGRLTREEWRDARDGVGDALGKCARDHGGWLLDFFLG